MGFKVLKLSKYFKRNENQNIIPLFYFKLLPSIFVPICVTKLHMITFREIELEDIEIINSNCSHKITELQTFVLLIYIWGKKFNTQFAVTDDWLFIRFKDNNGRNSYLKPIGTGDLKEGIELSWMIINNSIQFFRLGV